MRLWTIHPCYLDRQGLLAVWREALLAQAVLLGRTKGYTRHPQLVRFREQRSPVAAVASYLQSVHDESVVRRYRFNHSLIRKPRMKTRIRETRGQLLFEWSHLLSKLRTRSPDAFARLRRIRNPEPHPLFEIIPGKVRNWEKGTTERRTS